MAVFRRRRAGEIALHQRHDVDAAIGAAGPQAADHQFVVQHVVAHHVKRIAAVDPALHQLGFGRRHPGVAIAHQETPDGADRSSPGSAGTGRRRIFVFHAADVAAVVAQIGDA